MFRRTSRKRSRVPTPDELPLAMPSAVALSNNPSELLLAPHTAAAEEARCLSKRCTLFNAEMNCGSMLRGTKWQASEAERPALAVLPASEGGKDALDGGSRKRKLMCLGSLPHSSMGACQTMSTRQSSMMS